MFYKKFTKDKEKCIEIETVTISDSDKPIAFIQLTTDGFICSQEEVEILNASKTNLLPVEKYLQENRQVSIKKLKYLTQVIICSHHILKKVMSGFYQQEKVLLVTTKAYYMK